MFCPWKSWNGILKENNFFRRASSKVLTAFLWESRAPKLCTCSRYSNKCLRLAGEKFVLASESNLPLATGLASWKVSLEPCVHILSLVRAINWPIFYSVSVPWVKFRLLKNVHWASYVKYLSFKLHPIHYVFNDTTLSNLPDETKKKFNIMNSHVVWSLLNPEHYQLEKKQANKKYQQEWVWKKLALLQGLIT